MQDLSPVIQQLDAQSLEHISIEEGIVPIFCTPQLLAWLRQTGNLKRAVFYLSGETAAVRATIAVHTSVLTETSAFYYHICSFTCLCACPVPDSHCLRAGITKSSWSVFVTLHR